MNERQGRTIRASLAVTAIALIGIGFWLIYPPVSLIVLGALLWWDLMDYAKHERARKVCESGVE